MILIITHKEDFTADFIIDKLNQRSISYYRFNCEDINIESYSLQLENDFDFELNQNLSFDSVWFRRTKLPQIEIADQNERLYLLNDYDCLFDNIFNLINSKKWLSHPNFVYEAENKVLQLKIAKSIGLIIPDTIVTNNHDRLKKFIEKHNQDIIIKPIRQGRIDSVGNLKSIYTNKIDPYTINHISDFDLTPAICQEYIDKEYELRVTVVGEKLFVAKIDSQKLDSTAVDWRKEKMPFEDYVLPADVADKCIAIVKRLNLSFGAIDLIKRKNGDYVFLEINPNGQWAWLEIELGLKISDEIINFLTVV